MDPNTTTALGMLVRILIFVGSFIVIVIVGTLYYARFLNYLGNLMEKYELKINKGKNIDPFFPEIKDCETAVIVAKRTSALLVFIAIVYFIVGLFQIKTGSCYAFIDMTIFLCLALSVYKMNRMAAVIALSFYVLGSLYFVIVFKGIFSIGLKIIIIIGFIDGIRATFQFHKLKVQEMKENKNERMDIDSSEFHLRH